jgi:hypothetical protein
MRALKAGVVCFLLVFAIGWISGPIRELWAVPPFRAHGGDAIGGGHHADCNHRRSAWVIRRVHVP